MTRPYIPGQKLGPGETLIPGPQGQPIIIGSKETLPGMPPPTGPRPPGALPTSQQPIPPRVETTAPTTAEKFGKTPPPDAEILSIATTSGKDRWNVKVQIPGMTPGVSEQYSMSREEICRVDKDIPIPERGIFGFGAGQRWAPSPYPKKEVKPDVDLSDYPLRIQHAYKKGGIKAANKAIEEYNKYVERFKESLTASAEKRFREKVKATTEFFAQLKQMPPEIQKAFYEGGEKGYNKAIKEYNEENEAEIAEFEKTINSKDFPADLREIYYEKGPDAYNQAVHKRIKELESDIFSAGYPQELRDAYKKGGYEAFQKAYDKYMVDYNKAMKELEPYTSRFPMVPEKREKAVTGKVTLEKEPALLGELVIDIVGYLKDGKDTAILKKARVTDEDIKAAQKYILVEKGVVKYTQDYFKERGWKTEIPMADFSRDISNKEIQEYTDRVKEATDSYYEKAPEKRPTAIVKNILLEMMPVYGTYRYAARVSEGGFTPGEIWGIVWRSGLDLVFLAPIVGQLSAAARGTYMAGKAGAYLSAGVRARELAKAAGYVAVAELKAPFTAIAHPIQTLKVGLSPIETIFRGKKIPLSAVETKHNTARIPIKMVGDERTAIKLRDAVTDAMIHGKEGKALINNVKVKLAPAAINKLGRPVAISSTPDLRPYMDGAIIGKGKIAKLESGGTVILGEGKDLFVSPTFHSRFAEATSSGMKIKDAVPGGLIIRDDKILQQLAKSGKAYAGTAEIEAKLLKGIDLGKPAQYIISRTPYGKKLMFAVYGEKLTVAEMAKLKIAGSVDTLKQIFKPPISIKTAGISKYNELARSINERNRLAARISILERRGDAKAIVRAKSKLAEYDEDIETSYSELKDVYRDNYRMPIRTAIFNTTGGIFRIPGRAKPRKTVNITFRKVPTSIKRQVPKIEKPRVIVKPPVRIPPVIPDTRLPIKPGKGRVMPAPTKGRVTPAPSKTRVTLRLPDRRVPPKLPTGRIPPRVPPTRVPPTKPPTRVPPTKPPTRVPPTKPPIRVPPKPPLIPTPRRKKKEEWTPEEVRSAIAWRVGVVVHALKSPYRRKLDERTYNIRNLPEGLHIMKSFKGKGSQQRSAKVIGALPSKLTVDVGNQDVIITPDKKTGRVRIEHERDTTGTVSNLTITRHRPKFVKFSKVPGVISRKNMTSGHNKKRSGRRGRIIY